MSFDKPRILLEGLGNGKLSDEQRHQLHRLMKFDLKAYDTWRMVQDISGHLDGELADWPSHIQDAIHGAVEKQCIPKPGERVEIVAARCYHDGVIGEPSYVVVIVQAFPIFMN